MTVKVDDRAVLAIYIDANGLEVQREILSAAAKTRELSDADESFISPCEVMTIEINCLPSDRRKVQTEIEKILGPDANHECTAWFYTVQHATDDRYLRYVFDTQSRVPLELFADVIMRLAKEDVTRCHTLRMLAYLGCTWPCRPKSCNTKASCGFASGCPC
jgi:hypothetical protein